MVLIRKVPILSLSIMYAPRGFVFDLTDVETFRALVEQVRLKAREVSAIFLRVDPHITETAMTGIADPFLEQGFVHLPHRWSYWNAPRDVYRTDLSKSSSDAELFRRLDPKARNGVRKAKKEGVTIRPAESLEDVEKFHAVYKRFAIDKGFLLRSFDYQASLWREFISKDQGRLFLSIYDDEIIGGQICLCFGELCVEMHRGVLLAHQRLRVNEALVWEGMRWARQKGFRWYCQRGVGAGTLQKFKQKFAPELVSLVGYYDLCFFPRIYRIIAILEFKFLPILVNLLMRVRRRIMTLTRSI